MIEQLISRNLRVFAFDPSIGRQLNTLNINEVLVSVPGADFEQEDFSGPCGEYLEVIDFDPASELLYPPVDLNEPQRELQSLFAISSKRRNGCAIYVRRRNSGAEGTVAVRPR